MYKHEPPSPAVSPRIAIVGGGPGGLTLALLLARHGLAASVFELDAGPLSRPQGGSLDLHPESGQRALREAGLEAELRAIARLDDQELRLYDKHGALLHEDTDTSHDRPEVDRTRLRALLLASLPEGTVRWGQKVRRIDALPDGTHAIVTDGASGREAPSGGEASEASEAFDLIVGADGAWSRVRPLVSAVAPEYSGVTFVELGIADIDRRHPDLAARVGHGKIFALGDGQGLIAQRNDDGFVRVYLAFRATEGWLDGIVDLADATRARADLVRLFDGWSPDLTAFIARAGDAISVRPIVALPVGHRWEHRAGVTLLGDAAHVMSPFTGEGVNIAMLDATELALGLAAAGTGWHNAVRRYEHAMFERAAIEAAAAAAGIASAISTAAPASFLADLRAHQVDAA